MGRAAHIPAHVAAALERLITQYKDRPRIVGLLEALLVDVQSEEDMFFDLRDERSLFNATGVNLDRIGKIVGEARTPGDTEEEYRAKIQQRIFKNRSQGTPEVIIELVALLSGADRVTLLEGAIASFQIMLDSEISDNEVIMAIFQGIKNSKAAGVYFSGLTGYEPDEDYFTCDPSTDGAGFGDLNDPNVGGKFAKLLIFMLIFFIGLEQGGTLLTEGGDPMICEQVVTN